jgi:hypothetical protein
MMEHAVATLQHALNVTKLAQPEGLRRPPHGYRRGDHQVAVQRRPPVAVQKGARDDGRRSRTSMIGLLFAVPFAGVAVACAACRIRPALSTFVVLIGRAVGGALFGGAAAAWAFGDTATERISRTGAVAITVALAGPVVVAAALEVWRSRRRGLPPVRSQCLPRWPVERTPASAP